MKILFDSIFSNKQITKCANFFKFEMTTKYILENNPDAIIYQTVPVGDLWDIQNIYQHERLVYVPITASRDRWNQYYIMPPEMTNIFSVYGEYGDFDALVTARVNMIPALRGMMYFNMRTPDKFIGTYDGLPIFEFKTAIELWNPELQERLEIDGNLHADKPMVFADFERKKVVEEARKHLSFADLNKLDKRMCAGSVYLDMELSDVNPLEDEFRIVFIQRLDKTQRRPDEVFKIFHYVTAGGDKKGKKTVCDVYTNSQNAQGYAQKPEYSFINFHSLDRASYYQKIKEANIFITMSIDEGFPLGVFEALVHGAIGVIYRTRWSVDLLGEDYPFLIDNVQEAVAMTKTIMDDYEGSYAKFNEWRKSHLIKKIEETKGKKAFYEEMYEAIDDFVTARNKNFPKNNVGIDIDKWARANDIKELDIKEDYDRLKKEGVLHGAVFPEMSASFRWMENDYDSTRITLLNLGWKDRPRKGAFYRE